MSLRGNRIAETATLPDGREIAVDVGIARDSYVAARDEETVTIELRHGDAVLAALNTVLDPDDDSEARELAREVAAALESGALEPTAAAIEPLADRLR